MHGISVVLALIVAVSAAPKNVQWFEIEPAKVAEKSKLHSKAATDFSPYESAWKEFKIIHEKIYETVEEEIHRFNIFKETVKRIEEHNKKFHMGTKSYYLGINQFSDLTHDEYLKFNGLKKTGAREGGCSTYLKANNLMAPNNVDWRNKGYVTPVKNQGQCGSCWSFSTTGSLEGQHFRKTGKLVSLSEQQLVDCSGKFGNEGCNGGLMDNAFLYVKKAGGIEGEDDYPYKAEQGRCKVDKSLFKADDIGCVDVTSGDEDALKSSVAEVGPVSVAIDASHSSFQSYAGGIYDEPECSSHRLDHGVLTVGYGTDDEGQDYWLVKNSWGTTWGDEGYIKMSRNKDNQCGIATQASYPKV